MKLRSIALSLLLAGGLSTSCIKEDHSDCYNVHRLALSYMGDGKTEIFHEKIDRVQMYVFDEQNNCVLAQLLSDADVNARITTLPPLDPGDYRIVCVGNTYNTEMENITSGDYDAMTFADKDYLAGETVSGNDPLYWASVDYTVKPFDTRIVEVVETAHFASSHFDILVEVAGAPALIAEEGDLVIELSGVSPKTDFNNNAGGQPETYVMDYVYGGEDVLTATNNIMRHKNHGNVSLRLLNEAGDLLTEIDFAQHIAKYDIDVTRNECLIPFRIEFKGTTLNMEISVPTWFITNVTPEF